MNELTERFARVRELRTYLRTPEGLVIAGRTRHSRSHFGDCSIVRVVGARQESSSPRCRSRPGGPRPPAELIDGLFCIDGSRICCADTALAICAAPASPWFSRTTLLAQPGLTDRRADHRRRSSAPRPCRPGAARRRAVELVARVASRPHEHVDDYPTSCRRQAPSAPYAMALAAAPAADRRRSDGPALYSRSRLRSRNFARLQARSRHGRVLNHPHAGVSPRCATTFW